jgi:undecaprenyl-diphosphatase
MELVIRFLDDTLILVLGFLIPYFWMKKQKYLAGQLLIAGLWAWLISHLLKYWFYTPRPYLVHQIQALVNNPPTSGSFPSAHTATAFALAIIVFLSHKKLGLGTLLIAVLIGWLRIAGKVHYPIDIIGGAILGITIGLIIKYFNVNLGSLSDRRK